MNQSKSERSGKRVQSQAFENGQALFFQHACWRCHTLGGQELPGNADLENAGPDLLLVGDRLDKNELRESILDPNTVIAEPKNSHTNELGASKMPAFGEALSRSELADLVEFLSQSNSKNLAKSLTVAVTRGNFEKEVRQTDRLVLLDFWAEWCLPCLELEPILDRLALEHKSQLKICKIDVDANPELVAEFVPDNIFPCLILMKEGKLIERRYGTDPKMEPEAFLRQWIGQNLSREKP